MPWICAHTGDVHLEEDHYFGDTAQCLEWFVADAIPSNADLFVINGDLTTYNSTIKERNLWIDMVIRMADHAPVLILSGNHGKECDGDLYAYAKAKGKFSVYLCTEPEFIELDRVAIAVFPYPRKVEYVSTPEEPRLQEAFVQQLEEFNQRFARRPDSFRLFFGHFGVAGARVSSGSPWSGDAPSIPWIRCGVYRHSTSGSVTFIFVSSSRHGSGMPGPCRGATTAKTKIRAITWLP